MQFCFPNAMPIYMYVHLANTSTVVLCYMSCMCIYMYVYLTNTSTVVLCYMSCMCIYMFLNVCVVTVFMSAKSSIELMFVMLHCKPN